MIIRKSILFLSIFLIFNCKQSIGQKIIFKESANTDGIYFGISKSGVKRVKCSYSILKGSFITYLLKWGISNEGEIYWTNGENVYKLNFDTGESELIYSGLHFILEFFVRGESAHIVYNPMDEEDEYEGRYKTGIRFIKLNLTNKKITSLRIPESVNITGLSVSPNEEKYAFINTKFIDEPNKTSYELVVSSFEKNLPEMVVDKGLYKREEWFGSPDFFNSIDWIDDTTFFYYRHARGINGSIFCYNIDTKTKTVSIENIPKRDNYWFSCYNGCFYFSSRDKIYKCDSSNVKTVVLDNKKKDIQEALIFP